MATNEIANEEELGGAEMHSKISGVSDYLAEDELDGIRIARELMEIVKTTTPQLIPSNEVEAPKHHPDGIGCGTGRS